jgi:hypothetical protein
MYCTTRPTECLSSAERIYPVTMAKGAYKIRALEPEPKPQHSELRSDRDQSIADRDNTELTRLGKKPVLKVWRDSSASALRMSVEL